MRNYGLFLVVLLVLCGALFATAMASCPEPPHWADGQEIIRLQTIDWLDDTLSLVLKDGTAASVAKDSCFAVVSEPGDAVFPERRRILGFYQGNTWHEVRETHLNMRPGEVPRPELPDVIRVEDQTSTAEIAKELGVPEWKVQEWNHINRSGLLKGEVLFTSAPPDEGIIQRWSLFGGDPAGDELRDQIPRFTDVGIPEDLVQLFISQEAATEPALITLVSTAEQPLFLEALAFGGKRTGSKPKTWGKTACYWVRKHNNTVEPITEAEARVYPLIKFDGYLWQLVQFEECGNGAVIRYELGGELRTVSVTPPPSPAPQVAVTQTQESVSPSVPEPVRPARDWRSRGVAWLDGYRYEFQRSTHQWSGFAGMELAFRIGQKSFLGLPKFAIVPRVEQSIQAIDRNRFSRGGDYGGNYSLGAEFQLLHKWRFIVRPQAGGGYTHQERSWYTEWTEGGNRIKERKRHTFTDWWWYARPNFSGPWRSYAEYYIRRDFVHDEGLNVTVEPWHLYARYGWGRTTRGQQLCTDNVAGQRTEVSWPGDYYRISQAKVGINFTSRFLMYGIWEDQLYSSPNWYASSPDGVGVGTQIYFIPDKLRMVVEAKHWPNYDTVDRGWERSLTSQHVPAVDIRWGKARTHGNRQEYHVGLVYNW